MNPLVHFKEFSPNAACPSCQVDSTSSDLSLLSHLPYPISRSLTCPQTHPRFFISKYSFQGRLGLRCRNKNISMYHRAMGSKAKGLPQAVASVEAHWQETRFSWWCWEGHRPSTCLSPRPWPQPPHWGCLHGSHQSSVGSGLQSSRQKLSPLSFRNTVQGYTEKIDPFVWMQNMNSVRKDICEKKVTLKLEIRILTAGQNFYHSGLLLRVWIHMQSIYY